MTATTQQPAWLFDCKPFAALSVHQLHRLYQLRQQVFVVEQNCPYPDVDGHDLHAWHLFAHRGHTILATARLLPPGLSHAQACIGRVAVAAQARGQGLGRALMQRAVDDALQRWGPPVRISAQHHLQRFYASLGFKPVGEPYLEDNIAHIEMLRT